MFYNEDRNKIRLFAFVIIMCIGLFSAFYKGGILNDNSDESPTDSVNTHVQQPQITTSAMVEDKTGQLISDQTKVLEKYALLYADTLAYMEAQDISQLYADTDSREYMVNQAALEIITDIRSLRDIDLTLEYAQVNYVVDSVKNKSDKVEIYLLENNVQKFHHLTEPSYSDNI